MGAGEVESSRGWEGVEAADAASAAGAVAPVDAAALGLVDLMDVPGLHERVHAVRAAPWDMDPARCACSHARDAPLVLGCVGLG